jgi:hypothetical protein
VVKGEATYRTTHCIGNDEKPFTLIIQRKRVQGQTALDLEQQEAGAEAISAGGYIYRAIATNRESWSNQQIIQWYNQRAEDSENRIRWPPWRVKRRRLVPGSCEAAPYTRRARAPEGI